MKTISSHLTSTSTTSNTSDFFEKNYLKKARSSLFYLFSNIDSINLNYYTIHTIISIWRIIQFIGPAIAAPFPHFWESGTPYSTTASILSIFFHIIPPNYRDQASIIVEFIYIVLIFLTIIIITISTFQFKRSAKILNIIPHFIIIFVNGFSHILQPIVIEYIGESIGRLISSKNYYSDSVEISAIVFSLIFVFISFLFLYHISAVSFVFRPYSLMTILRLPQFCFSALVGVITFLTALASQLNKGPRVALTFISAFLYLLGIGIVFMPGSFIQTSYQNLIISASSTSFIMMILVAIYDLVGHYAEISELFIMIFLILIFYFASHFLLKKFYRYILVTLDTLGDDPDQYKSSYLFIQCATVGFVLSHETSQDWQMFKNGTEKWPNNLDLWIIFGKFAAIYPEEGKLLGLIIQTIQAKKFPNFISRQFVTQARIISTQREGSLSYELKSRLSKSARQVQYVKRKIRHVWDLAIQSNIIEMDSSINNAYSSINKARSNFYHLFAQYPNNRFVARAYAHFLYEIEGNQQLYKEWLEKISNLSRGILVNPDRTNILGVSAIPLLPIAVNHTKLQLESEIVTDNITSLIGTSGLELEEPNMVMNEQISVIQDRIQELTIPATQCIIIWTSFLYFIMILVPAVAVMIYESHFLHSLTSPLDYLYHISFLRQTAYQLPMLATHYLLEKVPYDESLNVDLFQGQDTEHGPYFLIEPNFTEIQLASYGFPNSTYDQLRYISHLASESVEKIAFYRTWIKNDPRIQRVHEIVFENSIPYTYYSDGKATNENISLQTAMMDITLQMTNILQDENIDSSAFNTSKYVNPIANANTISNFSSTALMLLTSYLTQNHTNIQNLMLFCMMFLCIIYVLIIIGILIFQIENLKACKFEIFQCLTALPKNEVSEVAQSLNLISEKDNEDEDDDDVLEEQGNLNKQDENIIKVFSSASDISSSKSTEIATYVILNLLLAACTVAIIVLLCQAFPSFSDDLQENAPHIDYGLGSVSFLFAAMQSLLTLTMKLHGYPIPLENSFSVMGYNAQMLEQFTALYHIVRYGYSLEEISFFNDSIGIPPFRGFANAREAAEPYFTCPNSTHFSQSFKNYYNCLSIDIQLNILEPFMSSIIRPYQVGITPSINPHNPLFSSLWDIIIKLYDKFFFPMCDRIVDDMKSILETTLPTLRTPAIILLIVCFFIVLVVYLQAHGSSEKMKFALSLLLKCPSNTVMQTSKVMDILSGEFGSKQQDAQFRHKEFFDAVVQSIPDSVIVLNTNDEIISMNRSTERIYSIKVNDVIGTHASSFFGSSKFSQNPFDVFNEGSHEVQVEYEDTEGDKSYLNLTFLDSKSHLIITTRDETQIYSYNKLISDEKEKSDHLLESILPPNLIKRVQNGEQNISFSVQSASILFLDIVSFTPWCAANTAQMIMSTLNIMFRELDARLARHSTLTKIKCIGDCYMAAGGIFVEVNQPAVHAKEMVEFGLEAIEAIGWMNKEYKQTLQIRVGVNTGGPIVAGVIGTDKPTFEILGPAINMAQQMEHHGVPMVVHISRSVYQLIYGGAFNIKERGKIEIKNGSVATYLVLPKGQ